MTELTPADVLAELFESDEFEDLLSPDVECAVVDDSKRAAGLVLQHLTDSGFEVRSAWPVIKPPHERNYLVWSNQHRAWWRPNGCGYVRSILGAGRYTKEEAVSISGDTRDHWTDPGELPEELAIPIDALPKAIRVLLDAAFPRAERSGDGHEY